MQTQEMETQTFVTIPNHLPVYWHCNVPGAETIVDISEVQAKEEISYERLVPDVVKATNETMAKSDSVTASTKPGVSTDLKENEDEVGHDDEKAEEELERRSQRVEEAKTRHR